MTVNKHEKCLKDVSEAHYKDCHFAPTNIFPIQFLNKKKTERNYRQFFMTEAKFSPKSYNSKCKGGPRHKDCCRPRYFLP